MYRMISIILFILIPAGCTTVRINQFKEFTKAGSSYVDAVEAVTVEAGNAVVDIKIKIFEFNPCFFLLI